MFTHKAVLPLRFCEKVGFFSGTDKANGEGETSLGQKCRKLEALIKGNMI